DYGHKERDSLLAQQAGGLHPGHRGVRRRRHVSRALCAVAVPARARLWGDQRELRPRGAPRASGEARMTRLRGIVRAAAERAAQAAHRTLEALADGRIEQEPAFTDRMLGHIEEAMIDFEVKGVRWRAKKLTDHGPNAQEKRFGADLIGVLDVD